jgi:hypothetical protein
MAEPEGEQPGRRERELAALFLEESGAGAAQGPEEARDDLPA